MKPPGTGFFVAAAGMIFLAGSMLGCQQSASCGALSFEATRQAVDARVDESGFKAKFKLDISGCQGQKVPVQFWSVNSAGGKVFLGEEIAVPPYENSTWAEFPIFIPMSRMANVPVLQKCEIYVCSPMDSSEFIGKAEYTLKEPYQPPKFIWAWKQWQDDASTDAGPAFHTSSRLDIRGCKGKKMDAVLQLEDGEGNILRSQSGDPLILSVSGITPGFDGTCYEKLSLDVPYEKLSHLRPGLMVCARPALRIDGQVEPGNLFIKFWAGGSLETLNKHYTSEANRLDQEIDQLDKRVKALEGGQP